MWRVPVILILHTLMDQMVRPQVFLLRCSAYTTNYTLLIVSYVLGSRKGHGAMPSVWGSIDVGVSQRIQWICWILCILLSTHTYCRTWFQLIPLFQYKHTVMFFCCLSQWSTGVHCSAQAIITWPPPPLARCPARCPRRAPPLGQAGLIRFSPPACTCILRKVQKDRSPMTLRNVKIQTKLMKPLGFEPWFTQLQLPNVPTRPMWLPEMKTCLRCTEYIFTKIWNCTLLAWKSQNWQNCVHNNSRISH